MARVDVAHRRFGVRTAPLLALSLAAGLAVAAVPGWATAAPTVARVATDPTEPAEEPTEENPTADPTDTAPVPTEAPPTTEPPPETTPPAPTTEPAATTSAPPPPPPPPTPTSAAPTSRAPLPPPPAPVPTSAAPSVVAPPPAVPPARPSAPALGPAPATPIGVRVTTGDLTLTPAYWNARSTVTSLRVTVTNTGLATERIALAYRLPAGVTDAGTRGCVAVGGGNHRCGEWTSVPGARFSALLRVRVDGDAWRKMPLSGSVRVTARVPGVADSVTDNEGFAVLFPPGPPAPGIRLRADEVSFDISGVSSGLDVRLTNAGRVEAAGRIDVVLPAGVAVPAPPAGCVAVDPTRTRCTVGTIPAGGTTQLRLAVAATPEAQREAPLAGAVIGQLDPRSGRTRQVQMTFRITAAAALATPVASAPAPTGSQGVLAAGTPGSRDGGVVSSVQRTAITLIAVSTLLVVLALVLATTSLRRRTTGPVPDPTTRPAATD